MRYLIILLVLSIPRIAHSAGCAEDSWATYMSPGPQSFERREVIEVLPGLNIIAIEFGPLAGDFAKLYIFLEDNGTCFHRAVSIGSYAFTNDAAMELGRPRVYHTDLYEFERHTTLDMSETPPSYEEARRLALQVLVEE